MSIVGLALCLVSQEVNSKYFVLYVDVCIIFAHTSSQLSLRVCYVVLNC